MIQGIIVLVVLSLCWAIRKAGYVSDNKIPLVALILGLALGVASVLLGKQSWDIISLIIVGLAPVGLHQFATKTFK